MTDREKFTEETINYISKLALLNLSEEEKKNFSKQLSDILSYFEKLNDLDTSEIEPTTHPMEGVKNVFREDKAWKSLSNEEALKNAEHTKDGYFKAPRILKE
ncbi:MAG: Asp-tRNA(Asn)/Glu-tRNA(Gln) amidotransferase subunit GatC [Candidatus Lokiarchaeota archaeon]|nr:Asp-tRNA(Asn)/Glu-tRNA(Gln) amidotransferase subunit GatC [Candidatus Lokiarchaeota archaeon]MBD3342539.1 Asp-tRNA(Asn)/Glu-tRNA(Gln) amidotransferase subunit GatC [Candidatus Lokiarchaeota archaeon]